MRLGFFFRLAFDVEDDHLGGAASLATGLDYSGEGVEALHEAEWAAGDAASAYRFVPVPDPHLAGHDVSRGPWPR
jgi:hypothetical protein